MIITADARHIPLRDGCVQCVVTSPPYWNLRDYGVGNQIGLEPTPRLYVAKIVSVFAEVWRVLRDDGTVWLNLGDSYASTNPHHNHNGLGALNGSNLKNKNLGRPNRYVPLVTGMKPKDLVGIPWRVAFALQAFGWYLRSDIIWAKPAPMPESVTDRPTTSHEHLFLLTKNQTYYYDAAAIAEPAVMLPQARLTPRNQTTGKDAQRAAHRRPTYALRSSVDQDRATRNKRDVWTIASRPYAGAHYAVFPEALVEPCILAGCPMGGLVLDPFIGSGTVGAVAERLGRRWVGTDLSYQPLSTTRTAQRGLRFEPDEVQA